MLGVNQNISAVKVHRNLLLASASLGNSVERLSSGLRINRASDNPAGLVISEIMRSQVSGLGVAIQNASEGVNMVKTAEAALTEVQSILRKMRDLALDAASTTDTDQIAADQAEIEDAITSLNNIAQQTQYGNVKLLDGTAGRAGRVDDIANFTGVSGASDLDADVAFIDVDLTTAATKATIGDAGFTETYAGGGTDTVNNAGTIVINGVSFTINATDTVQNAIDKINEKSATTGVTASLNTDQLKLDANNYGSDQKIEYSETAEIFITNGGFVSAAEDGTAGVDAVAKVKFYKSDGTTQVGYEQTLNAGKGLTLEGYKNLKITLKEGLAAGDENYGGAPEADIWISGSSVTFQIGANKNQTTAIAFESISASNLGTTADSAGVAGINLASDAQGAIDVLDAAIKQVSDQRSRLGAFQTNILESSINSLGVAMESLAASESTLRDADMAAEMITFTKSQILLQTGTAMLAQANAVPQAILQLLR